MLREESRRRGGAELEPDVLLLESEGVQSYRSVTVHQLLISPFKSQEEQQEDEEVFASRMRSKDREGK